MKPYHYYQTNSKKHRSFDTGCAAIAARSLLEMAAARFPPSRFPIHAVTARREGRRTRKIQDRACGCDLPFKAGVHDRKIRVLLCHCGAAFPGEEDRAWIRTWFCRSWQTPFLLPCKRGRWAASGTKEACLGSTHTYKTSFRSL